MFGDITFEWFEGVNVKKISSNLFNKTENKIKTFECFACPLEHEPPKYNVQSVFNRMTELNDLKIGLNVTEIPSNAFGKAYKLETLNIYMKSKGFTIKSSAFENLENLRSISFLGGKINRIEKEAFKIRFSKFVYNFHISLSYCNITSESFQNGSFDGIHNTYRAKPILTTEISLSSDNFSYLSEEAFDEFLVDEKNSIIFNRIVQHNNFDCEDCRNYWLVKGRLKNQVKDARCKQNLDRTVFGEEFRIKLRQKCK